jgi:hypothetical protein
MELQAMERVGCSHLGGDRARKNAGMDPALFVLLQWMVRE